MSNFTFHTHPTPLRAAAREAAEWGWVTPEERDEMLVALRGLRVAAYVQTSTQYGDFCRCGGSALVVDLAVANRRFAAGLPVGYVFEDLALRGRERHDRNAHDRE